jgi:uncharacterized protein (UPF0335 family)
VKRTLAAQPALFNTDPYELPASSFAETHPDSEDVSGDDTESSVPDDWEQLRKSNQRCAELRARIQAIYADAQAEGFTRRMPIEYERAIRELNYEVIAELEASKKIRTRRHNYRGWIGEIEIGETLTKIRIIDADGWLTYDDIIKGTSKAVAMLRMTQFIDAAIEREERERSQVIHKSYTSHTSDDSVSPALPSNDSVSPDIAPDTESITEVDTESITIAPDTESTSGLKYVARGTARTKSTYFRYSYREAGKMKHVHIPGGNTQNPVARRNWELVLASKQKGMTSFEIVAMIKTM